ncbi:MAG: DUF4382 domain-containing protein [Bacteroidota bacterium]
MKSILHLIGSIALISVLIISCEKSDDTGINLQFKGETSSLKAKTTGGTYDFTEALMGLSEIEIEMEMEDDDNGTETEIEYDYEGNYTVDLLAGTSDPKIGFSEFEPGTYNEVEAEIEPILDGGTKSIIIKGTLTDAEEVVTEFEFSTSEEIEIEIESEIGFYLDEGTIIDMVVTFDLDMLFDGVDMTNAERNESDVVIINDTTNSDLAAIIKSNIESCADLEEDDDDDDDDDD